jgi:DNA-binding YbaB/EbfC family protein
VALICLINPFNFFLNFYQEKHMNINMLMQQAQRMQKDMEGNVKKAKEQLAQTEVHAEAGGGLVKVSMTGRFVVKRIQIDPELLKDDADIIEDLIAAAINDAVRQAETVSEETMQKANSGMGLPPGMAGLF